MVTKRLAVAIAVSVTLAACGGDQTGASAPGATGTVGPSRDIVEMLEADGRFTTFLRLLRTDAGPNCCLRLEKTLAVTTLTVFAPTDAAFASLPPDLLPTLIEDDLGLCGDAWGRTSRIETAWLSGDGLGRRLAARIAR